MADLVHGHTRRGGLSVRQVSPEYRAWAAMKNRCLNPKQARYGDYGGRGIGICDRWLQGENNQTAFLCFLGDVGPKPSPAHSLDRIDNDRGYEPGNVRWASRSEQARNTRASVLIDVCGVEVALATAIERWAAVPANTVRMRRHRGWTIEDALFVPPRGRPGQADYPVVF